MPKKKKKKHVLFDVKQEQSINSWEDTVTLKRMHATQDGWCQNIATFYKLGIACQRCCWTVEHNYQQIPLE